MNKDKNYCSKCGRLLLKSYVEMHYNMLTGIQKHNIVWRCPKWFLFSGHSKFKSDENGNTYSFEV